MVSLRSSAPSPAGPPRVPPENATETAHDGRALRRSEVGALGWSLWGALVVLLGASASAGCSGKDPYSPGTKLGVYRVDAKLTSSTCGAVPDPWQFDVRLNHDGSTLYWIQGGAPIQGRVDTNASALFEATVTNELRAADTKTRRAACSVARNDTLAITIVAADAKPNPDPAVMKSFVGSLVYDFVPLDGSDCSDQLTATGGDFDILPCSVRYELTGAFSSAQP